MYGFQRMIGTIGKKKSLERHYNKWGYIFALPFVVAFLVFHFWPMSNTILFAFCDLQHVTETDDAVLLTSHGLPWYKNFADLIKTTSFSIAIKNTFKFWILYTIPEFILAFWLAATMTDRRLKIKGRALFKTGFFFSKLLSGSMLGGIISSGIIGFVTSTVYYILLAAALNGFGVTEKDFQFFLSEHFLIILVSIFMHFGITFIYAVAGMTSVPVEIYEAAEMDGSSRLNTFFRITLPCMRPLLFFIVVVSVVDGLTMSDVPAYIGNMNDVTNKSLTMMNYLGSMLGLGRLWGKGGAFCLILLAMSAAISGLIYFFLIRDKYDARLKRMMRKKKRQERLLLEAREN